MTTALEGGEESASRPGRSLPPGKTRYPLYRRLGGPQGRSGQLRKISPPPGFDPRTVQPVAIRYTDYATRPTNEQRVALKFYFKAGLSATETLVLVQKAYGNEALNRSNVLGWYSRFRDGGELVEDRELAVQNRLELR
jgi:hypothetical protein